MDLETFFTTLYVIIDDWYTAHILPVKPRRGAPARLSDSEVLTIMIAGQWRQGVPWYSERSLVRLVNRDYRHLFPRMLQRSAFNERARRMFGVFVRLQQAIGQWLTGPDDIYEAVDCLPLPAYSLGQGARASSHWLWMAMIGKGAGQWFIGDHLLLAVTPTGVVTGWLCAAANINDRWLLEAFLSTRQGRPQLVGPAPDTHRSLDEQPLPPVGQFGPWLAVGASVQNNYIVDKGFNGPRWRDHWGRAYGANVLSVPPANTPAFQHWSPADQRWLASIRQCVETAFAHLDAVFGIKKLQAHSLWGKFTRLAAKMAAYNLGIYINRLLQRPSGALATLLA